MSETSNTIDKNVDEQIVKVLERFKQAYDARIALGPLKSSAYTRLRRDGLLTPEFIKSEYGLIAEKKSKLPSTERAFIAYVMNVAISRALNTRLQMTAKQEAEKAEEEQVNAEEDGK